MHRRTGIVAALVVVAAFVTGCSGPSIRFTQTAGIPTWATLADTTSGEPQAFAHDHELAIVTWGSSSCPPTPTAIDPGVVPVITFEMTKHEICTADMAPTSFVFPAAELGGSVPSRVTVKIDVHEYDLAVAG